MTFADLSPLANRLWQSTLFAAAAWLLTLALRKNRAAARYWLWLAASVKFLIPFSLLVSAGAQLGWRAAPAIAHSQFSFAMGEIGQPFAATAPTLQPAVGVPVLNPWPAILFGIWLCGIAIGVVFWLRWWRQIRAVRRAATPLDLNLPIQVMSSPARLEPGIIGIFKPVLLLPEGITEHLTPAQLEAILAHELRHVERRDNLTAAIHMLVETIFWFHPLAWWIRTRLMEERERACDEDVMRAGREAQVYAESILKVCEFYLTSPVACAAGVTGGELKKRIESIMANRFTRKLSCGKKLLLASAAILVIAGPVVVGLLSPARGRAQAQAAPLPSFEVASVKPRSSTQWGRGGMIVGGPGTGDPTRITFDGPTTLARLIYIAYDVPFDQISGPAWLQEEHYDIAARVSPGATKDQVKLMWQNLLAERFKLVLHREPKEFPVYELTVAKGGAKLKPTAYPDAKPVKMGDYPSPPVLDADGYAVIPPGIAGMQGVPRNGVYLMTFQSMPVSTVIGHIEFMLGSITGPNTWAPGRVVDKTGLTGMYDYKLEVAGGMAIGSALQPQQSLAASTGPDGMLDVQDPGGGPDLFRALEKQLGLTLTKGKGIIDVLVVDHAERVPTAN